MRKLEKNSKPVFKWALGLLMGLGLFTGCSDKVQFVQQSSTKYFTQDFIPEYVDIMWMINNRSPMADIRVQLRDEASKFFQRLDTVSHQYQMAFVTADMEIAKGALAPNGSPVVLTKSLGTPEQRTAIFANNVINNLLINVRTGGLDKGFQSLYQGLTVNQSTTPAFALRESVPLVLVMISDSDDHSPFDGADAVDYWSAKFLELKGNNPDLLRVYAINYTASGDRCTNSKGISADINKSDFEDRYFRLADKLGGQKADLCGTFADDIDLTGLKLEQLKTRFMLDTLPNPATIQVSVLMDGTSIPTSSWHYESATNEIVFDVAPPEGSTIAVTFLPGSGA